jgi:hypothetical protein
MKYPLSAADKAFPERLVEILNFHLPRENSRILDLTCGQKLSWKYYFEQQTKGLGIKYQIIFSDIKDNGDQDFVCDFVDLDFRFLFDAIFFDPPFVFGLQKTTDRRSVEYGNYGGDYEEFVNLIGKANVKFPDLLKGNGLVFLKYSDNFTLKPRRYYHSSLWLPLFTNFEIIDCFITLHHHISGTAWQVKDRPFSIGNYTYLAVMRKRQ